ncbi:hypothetical protein [Fulvivirga sp. M361]|uniref:hypothetical protein n=1 Tax=Fulvivirga sp. M361 TaxID=2594266 RepID=UPI001625BB6A|nr:hypothetical protein [Fulvivirga sp. M361]
MKHLFLFSTVLALFFSCGQEEMDEVSASKEEISIDVNIPFIELNEGGGFCYKA